MGLMPKGYPINPEKTRKLRSLAHKNKVWSDEHLANVRQMLIKRNKSKEHIAKVKKANTGKPFTLERRRNMVLNHADTSGDNNPNWRGDKVGKIGIHIWLRKNFKKKMVCEFCGNIGNTPLSIDWAKLKDKLYERKRENFIELCRSCHSKYDGKGKHLNKKKIT